VAQTTWRVQHDSSCLAAHPRGDAWKCRDPIHVLMNHVSTPFMLREDFTDSNHSSVHDDHQVDWGPPALYPHCQGTPCPPKFKVPAEHRPRLEEQADRLWTDFPSRSELALGTDGSLGGAGLTPSFAIWMPNCGVHAGVYDDDQFFRTTISHAGGVRTMRSLLESFMTLPRTGQRSQYRDGLVDGGGFVSATVCP